MKKLMFFAILFCLCLSGFCQTTYKKTMQNSFIKWYMGYKRFVPMVDTFSVNFQEVLNSEELARISRSLKLSRADRHYLAKQLSSAQYVMNVDTSSVTLPGPPVNNFINFISHPIFSKNNCVAIIAYAVKCPGDCGEMGVDVFAWKAGVWKHLSLPTRVLIY